MNQLLKIISGNIVALTGVALLHIGVQYILGGNFIWIPVVLASLTIFTTGVISIRGKNIRGVPKDLVSMPMWWVPS